MTPAQLIAAARAKGLDVRVTAARGVAPTPSRRTTAGGASLGGVRPAPRFD